MSWDSIKKFDEINIILIGACFSHIINEDGFIHHYEDEDGVKVEYDCKGDYFKMTYDNKETGKLWEEIYQGNNLNGFTISQALLNFGIK